MGDAKAQAPKVMMAEIIEMLVQRTTFFDRPFLDFAAGRVEVFGLSVLAITDSRPC
jgi:hypothetical protein